MAVSSKIKSKISPTQVTHIAAVVLSVILCFVVLQVVKTPLHVTQIVQSHAPWFTVILLYVALVSVIVFHEVGHVIGGGLVGMKLLSFSVWPFRISHQKRGWRFQVSFNQKAPLGQATVLPVNMKNLRTQYLVHHVAGPTLGLISSLLAGWLLLCHVFPMSSVLDEILMWITILGLWINLLSILPINLPCDGSGIKMLLNKGQLGERFGAYLGTVMQISYGKHYSDLDISLLNKLALPVSIPIGAYELFALHHSYYWSLDVAQFDTAKTQIDRMNQLTEQPEHSAITPWVALESAYFYGRHVRNVDLAALYLEDSSGAVSNAVIQPYKMEALRSRSEAALEFARGNLMAAKEIADLGLVHNDKLVNEGSDVYKIVSRNLQEFKDWELVSQ